MNTVPWSNDRGISFARFRSRLLGACLVLSGGLVFTMQAHAAGECDAFPIENRIQSLGGAQTSFAQGTVLDSGETLRAQFSKYEADVRTVLASHGLDHVADALLNAVASGEGISEGTANPGDDFQWMAWRRKGEATTTAPVCLETSQTYDTYEIAVSIDDGNSITTHRFSLPKVCMNIAYLGAESTPKPAPAPIPAAPVETPAPAPAPEPEAQSNAFFGPFVGLERRTRDLCTCVKDVDSGLVGVLGGIRIPTETTGNHILLQVGAAANLRESEWSTLFADVGIDFNVGERGFMGAGAGIWDINNSEMRDTNLYVHGGRSAWKWNEHDVQWFVQGRVFLDSDDVDDEGSDYAILGGLRVLLDRNAN